MAKKHKNSNFLDAENARFLQHYCERKQGI